MTDAPKAMSLPASDWRSLTLSNLVELHTFLSGIHPLNADQARAVIDQIDKVKLLATQWHAMSVQSQVATTDLQATRTNGAAHAEKAIADATGVAPTAPAKRKYTKRVRAAPAPAVA